MLGFFLFSLWLIFCPSVFCLSNDLTPLSSLRSCCNVNNEKEYEIFPGNLLKCVNDSAVKRSRSLESTSGYKIGIVTFSTQRIYGYSAYSALVNEAYCAYNHYHFEILDQFTSDYESYDARLGTYLKSVLSPQFYYYHYYHYYY